MFDKPIPGMLSFGLRLIFHVGIKTQHVSLEISNAITAFVSMLNVSAMDSFTVTTDQMS